MDFWPFNIRKKNESCLKLLEPIVMEVYVRNELNILRVEDAVNLTIALAKGPNWHNGVKIPDGNFISTSHFERLPENLKKFFDKTTMPFERI